MGIDRSDPFGAATTWAFFPGMFHPMFDNGGAENHKIFHTLGQFMLAELKDDSGSFAEYNIKGYSGDTWGYNGLCASFIDQQSSGGAKFTFGTGSAGQIDFPNKQSWTIWGLHKPVDGGDGPSSSEDPRLLSRDKGSGTNDHMYMIGGVRSSGTKSRTRCSIGSPGSTTTLVGTLSWQENALNFICATYDGSTLSIHTLREDGQYSVSTTSESGDINDETGASMGLALGGNFDNDNAYEGEILGAGVLDCPLDESAIRAFASDVTRIVKPAAPMVYFFEAASGSITMTISESVGIADAQSGKLSTATTIVESAAIVDVEAGKLSTGISISEAAASTDSSGGPLGQNQTLIEAISSSDSLSDVLHTAITVELAANATDLMSTLANYGLTIAESANIADIVSAATAGGITLTISDIITAADNVSISANFKMTISESALILDSESSKAGFLASISEAVSGIDTVSTTVPSVLTLTINEAINALDSLTYNVIGGMITAMISINPLVSGNISESALINGNISDMPLIDGEINDIPVITGTITVS